MAKLEPGQIGLITGKIGTVVGGKWRGITYVRAKGPSKRTKNSPAQITQQAKFKVAAKFASQMLDLFQLTYSNSAVEMTERNSALAHIVKDAIGGSYPSFYIDYPKVMISQGALTKSLGVSATVTQGELNTVWNYVVRRDGEKLRRDSTIVVAYCPFYGNVIYSAAVGTREENESSLDVSVFAGQTVHTWLAFIRQDNTSISDSVYTGEFVVTV